jgi:TonB family protein
MRTSPLLLAWMILTAAPAWAQDAQKPCTMPDTPLHPVFTTHTQVPYPPISQMTAEQGTAQVEVSIDAKGVPTDVTVVKSSGSARLDQASVDHLKQNWRWTAPVVNCQPTATKTQVLVTFNLRDVGPVIMQAIYMQPSDYLPDALKRHEEGTATIGLALKADGTVAQAIMLQGSGFPDLDTRSVELVRSWHWVPANLNGRTLDSVVYFRLVWHQATKK